MGELHELIALDQTSLQIEIHARAAHSALLESGLLTGISLTTPNDFDSTSRLLQISIDHRQCSSESIFIALQGTRFDGHSVIPSLTLETAAWIVAAQGSPPSTIVPTFFVTDTRAAWSCLCARAMGNPEKKLTILGVTGTNGKTSTVWYIRQILRILNVKSVSFGTLGCFIEDEQFPSAHTTPDPPLFFKMLALAVKRGCTVLEMEVSSHAIAQKRLFGVHFDGAAFTSFSRDHLDFHHTMENYLDTKMQLFEILAKPGAIFVVHVSQKENFVGRPNLVSNTTYYTYKDSIITGENAFGSMASIRVLNSEKSCVETNTSDGNESGRLAVVGGFALENFLAAKLLVRGVLGMSFGSESWPEIIPVPGRLELVRAEKSGKPTSIVVVDYAHTPDALEKAISCLRESYNSMKLLVIFGCGGDRDRGKRPQMGRIAAELADQVIVTSDNPRNEKPIEIINEIYAGVPKNSSNKVRLIEDRAVAIATALRESTQGWIVLIAGKGHEDYQEVGNQKFPFDDRKIARAVLESL